MSNENNPFDPDMVPVPEATKGVFWGSVLDVQPEGVVALLRDSVTREEGIACLDLKQLPAGVNEILEQGKLFWLDASNAPDLTTAEFGTNSFGFMTPDPITGEDSFGYH